MGSFFKQFNNKEMKEDLDYWKRRCELAENFIEEHPCDPDITNEQTEAYNKWCEFKKLPIPSVSGMFISTDYLMGLHPELNIEEADSLKEYANSHTISYRECYGDGSIIYPKWKEANYR